MVARYHSTCRVHWYVRATAPGIWRMALCLNFVLTFLYLLSLCLSVSAWPSGLVAGVERKRHRCIPRPQGHSSHPSGQAACDHLGLRPGKLAGVRPLQASSLVC